jgi:hypothetical protein
VLLRCCYGAVMVVYCAIYSSRHSLSLSFTLTLHLSHSLFLLSLTLTLSFSLNPPSASSRFSSSLASPSLTLTLTLTLHPSPFTTCLLLPLTHLNARSPLATLFSDETRLASPLSRRSFGDRLIRPVRTTPTNQLRSLLLVFVFSAEQQSTTPSSRITLLPYRPKKYV